MKFFAIFFKILLLGVFSFEVIAQPRLIFNPFHLIDSASSVLTGIAKQVGHDLPTPNQLLRGSQQLLVGLPEMAVFRTIDQLCSLYLASGNIDPSITPDINEMFFQLRLPCKSLSFPLKQAQELLESSDFDINKKVVVFISGWTSTIESDSILQVAKAYNCRGDHKFLALNASYFLDTLYTWSAFNTEAVGYMVAEGLIKLYSQVPAENIHLVGFSLGAHIAGIAGRYFKELTGQSINRITGLDPANPCFSEGEALAGLQRGDANFIDIIHTNPGVLGKKDPLGDIDFYVQGLAPFKPGCIFFGCSHNRAWKYYAESVYPGHENDYLAIRCSTLKKVEDGLCAGFAIPMGYDVPTQEKGTYFLSVYPQTPYGRNAQNYIPTSECDLCDNDYE